MQLPLHVHKTCSPVSSHKQILLYYIPSNASFVDVFSQIPSCCHWELSDTHLRHRLKSNLMEVQDRTLIDFSRTRTALSQRSEWLLTRSQNTNQTEWLVREKATEGIILAIWRPQFSAARKIFIRGE